jgi:3'(2'), 5'-bisphosphate nucleotidase
MRDAQARIRAARKAVSDACVVCRAVQREVAALRAELKDDRSPVTIADWASQAVVVRRLREELGAQAIVAEEDASALRADGRHALRERVLRAVRIVWPDATLDDVLDAIDCAGAPAGAPPQRGFWTLDPIDGTKGFLRGEQYAISLSWVEGGRPGVGALACPNLSEDLARPFGDPDPHGQIFWVERGRGVQRSAANGTADGGEPLKRAPRPPGAPLRLCQSVEKEHSDRDGAARLLAHLGERSEAAQLDSQAKYAVVARGQADVYLRLPTRRDYVERIWDHAAGSLIAEEAGCRVSDVRGARLDFTRGRGLEANRGIVCADPELQGRLLDAIRALGLDLAPPEPAPSR